MLKSIKRARNLKGKTVLIRADFNVPITRGKVTDDTRIVATLPTIEYLITKGARVVLACHIGRPDGKWLKSLSTVPVAKCLGEHLGKNVVHINALAGPSAYKQVKKLKDGQVALLENMRYSPEEKGNTGVLSASLAAMADVFVMDGFGVAHRADASIIGPAAYIPSFAGLLLEKEVNTFDTLLAKPARPFIAVIGGAKMKTKIPVLNTMLKKASKVLVGGGILNTMLKARGYDVGSSIVDTDHLADAKNFSTHKKLLMPVDVVIGKADGTGTEVVDIGERPHALCADDEAVFDIGPKTQALYEKAIGKAKTVLWNGALGYFEQAPYETGTNAVAIAIAAASRSGAMSVIGGGETIESARALDLLGDYSHVSTGGGAMLSYVAGETLPGVAAVQAST